MRYNGSKYGNSEWSNTVVINTLDIEEKIVLFNDSRLVSSTWVTPIINNSYYFMLVQDNSATGNTNVLVKYNLNNEVMLAKKINIPNINRANYGNVYYHNNNLYVAIRIFSTTSSRQQSILIKLDLNLNIIKSVRLNSSDGNVAGELNSNTHNLVFIDNVIYQYGHYSGTLPTGIFFMKLDLDLNKIGHYYSTSGVWSYIRQIVDLGTNILIVVGTELSDSSNTKKTTLLLLNKNTHNKVKEISILNPNTTTHIENILVKKNADNIILMYPIVNNTTTIYKFVTLDYSLNIIKDEKIDSNKIFRVTNFNVNDNLLVGVGNIYPSPSIDVNGRYTTSTNGQFIINGDVSNNTLKMLEISNYPNLIIDYNIDNNKYLLQGYKTSAIINISIDYNNLDSNGYILNTVLVNKIVDNTTILTTSNVYIVQTASPVINTITGVTLTDVDYFNDKTEILI